MPTVALTGQRGGQPSRAAVDAAVAALLLLLTLAHDPCAYISPLPSTAYGPTHTTSFSPVESMAPEQKAHGQLPLAGAAGPAIPLAVATEGLEDG